MTTQRRRVESHSSFRSAKALVLCFSLIPLASARTIFAAGSTALNPQSGCSVAGVVTDQRSGEVVIGAAVMIFADAQVSGDTALSGHPLRGVITNKFGFFSLAQIPEGRYWLVVRSLGYLRFARKILVANQPLRVDITLEPESIGNEVTVTAQKNPAPTASISSINVKPDMLQHLPSLGGETDIFRALQLLPGVKSSSEISSGLYVRGGSPDQNLTLLDGVIVYNPTHLAGFMSTFNSDAIQDIHLIKGAFPAEYGGRISSVLDLTMKEGTKEKIEGTAGISMIDSRLMLEGPISDNSTFMISGRRMYLDLLYALAPTDSNSVTPDYYFYDLNGKVNYKLGENDHLFLSGYFGRDVFGTPIASDSNVSSIYWGNATGNLRWSHIISPNLFTNFSAIYTNYTFSADLEDKHFDAPPDNNFKSVSGIQDYTLHGDAQYFPERCEHVQIRPRSDEPPLPRRCLGQYRGLCPNRRASKHFQFDRCRTLWAGRVEDLAEAFEQPRHPILLFSGWRIFPHRTSTCVCL